MTDKKLLYVTKTLSRTNRKDYENFIINAVFNRVANANLVQVSQQMVRVSNDKRYFIDLYFPALKIGIECDEGYHDYEEQKTRDAEREVTIAHILKHIDKADYESIRIKVNDTYENVEAQINGAVEKIKDKINEIGGLSSNEWKFLSTQDDLEQFVADNDYISVYDDISFHSNKDVYNFILGEHFKYHRFDSGSKYKKLVEEHNFPQGSFPWFPKLTIKPTRKGYINILSDDGLEIREYNAASFVNKQRMEESRHIGSQRIVFTQVENQITRKREYKFAGVFQCEYYDDNGILIMKRVLDKFKIIK